MRRPPFCPHRGCPCHIDPDSPQSAALARRKWFKRNGSYPTKVRGSIVRFRCLVCGRGFSTQTFSLDYYTKRIIDYNAVRRELCSSSSVRSTARSLGCSCDSVTNRTSRFARQCISASSRLLTDLALNEDLAADGFESFAVSQYFPNNIHILAGSLSQLVYFCDYVTLRRSGRMTPLQKRMREALEALYRPSAKALTESFAELLAHVHVRLERCERNPLTLNTDRKLEYCRALTACEALAEPVVEKRLVHARTDSRIARDARNPLFPVNYIDRELRKDLAEHVRETVRFARNVNHCMERLWIYLLDHNTRKRFRINDPVTLHRTHAREAGVDEHTIAQATALLTTRRRFLSFEQLEPAGLRVWRREHHTPLKGIAKGALREIRRQARRGAVDLGMVRKKLKGERLIEDTRQYLPMYALA
jgi:transposase-like protein